jgi:dephospho-CoA kinase
MKFIDFLTEQTEKHAVLAFGRMNPITSGHQTLVNKVKDIAQDYGASHHIVLSHTTDPKKNPLTGAQKLKHAKRAFPKTNFSVANAEHPTFLQQAAKLHKQGVTHLHMIGGSDRVEEFHNLLHKYNGKHKAALFNFKDIQVHSAGERDPDAEGVSGMSASKMREHATNKNYKEFKKGAPSTMADEHVKDLYNDVRKGMGIREDVDLGFEMLLTEGVHDKGIFKAVFLAGGPGSGKDYVLSNTLDGQGLTEINSDKALEYLMDKNQLDKRMPKNEKDKRDIIRGRAKSITDIRERLSLEGRNGVIINGTGDDYEKIASIKEKLEALGYETKMIMVNTADEVSRDRNVERGQRGGRTVPEDIRKQKWDSVQASRAQLSQLFKSNYVEFDNSTDLRNADDATRKAKQDEMNEIFKDVQKFISKPPKNDVAKDWIASELEKKDKTPLMRANEAMPHAESGAAEKAREMGLDYYGFGRYGKDGKVLYRSVHDKLVDVQPKKPEEKKSKVKPASKEPTVPKFETMIKESYDLSSSGALNLLLLGTRIDEVDFTEFTEEKQVNLLRDGSGKVVTFMLRSAAAKEAHTKNGTVVPYKNGYVVKLKGNQNDYHTFEENIRKENVTGDTTSTGRTFQDSRDPSGNQGSQTTPTFLRETKSFQGNGERKATITLKEIREKQFPKETEKVILSEAGINDGESGLSMATSGENMGRGALRTKIVKKPLEELTGDETTASIGDQKEDELKKKGISLSSFKKRNYI